MKTYQENAEKNFSSGWNASKDKYGTFYHEIGHAVWEDIPQEARSEIREIYKDVKHQAYEKWIKLGGSGSGVKQADVFGKELSRYAIENEQEFFSEAFSQIMSGRMRPASRRTNEVLNKYYKKSVAKGAGSGIINLTDSELGALKQYKSSESYVINEALRNADSLEELSEIQQKLAKELDSALLKMPKYEGDLLRTVDFSDWPDADQKTEKFLEAYVPGKKIKIKQYWSAAKKTGYNENASVKIYIQDSKRGRDISFIGLDEDEVLYERDALFDVISREFQDGFWHILVKEA